MLRLLLLRELTARPLGHGGVTAAARALSAHGLVGYDRDRVVERRLHPGFEQQRHLHHGGGRWRICLIERGAPGRHAGSDPRPERALEPRPRLLIAEHPLGDQRAVECTVPGHIGAEALDHGVAQLVVVEQLVNDGVGREGGGARARPAREAPPTCPRRGRR